MALLSLLNLDTPLSVTFASCGEGNPIPFRLTHSKAQGLLYNDPTPLQWPGLAVGSKKWGTGKKNTTDLTFISISDFWIWNLVKRWEWRGIFPVIICDLPRANNHIKYLFTAPAFNSQIFLSMKMQEPNLCISRKELREKQGGADCKRNSPDSMVIQHGLLGLSCGETTEWKDSMGMRKYVASMRSSWAGHRLLWMCYISLWAVCGIGRSGGFHPSHTHGTLEQPLPNVAVRHPSVEATPTGLRLFCGHAPLIPPFLSPKPWTQNLKKFLLPDLRVHWEEREPFRVKNNSLVPAALLHGTHPFP